MCDKYYNDLKVNPFIFEKRRYVFKSYMLLRSSLAHGMIRYHISVVSSCVCTSFTCVSSRFNRFQNQPPRDSLDHQTLFKIDRQNQKDCPAAFRSNPNERRNLRNVSSTDSTNSSKMGIVPIQRLNLHTNNVRHREKKKSHRFPIPDFDIDRTTRACTEQERAACSQSELLQIGS